MSNNAITQHYWYKQTRVVQPPKAADKTREDKQDKQSFLVVLKKQFKKDGITVVLVGLASILGLATVVTQIGKVYGW